MPNEADDATVLVPKKQTRCCRVLGIKISHMKIIKKFAVIVIASFVLGFSFYLIRPAANCNFESAYQIKPLSVGLHKIQAAVADTDALRQNGLGDRSCINKNAGMLFIFDTP